MALYPRDLPWLHKPGAVRTVAQLLAGSAIHQHSSLAYLDFAGHPGESEAGTPFWEAPRAQGNVWRAGLRDRIDEHLHLSFDAPADNVGQALAFLVSVRGSVPIGSFVFVLSDFIEPVATETWAQAVERGWDVVPVIVQDPVWEQSFPRIDGVLVQLADAQGRSSRHVRLHSAEVERRRRSNEERLTALTREFRQLGLDPVVVGENAPDRVHARMLEWSQSREIVARGAA
jgi:hypothetical protein